MVKMGAWSVRNSRQLFKMPATRVFMLLGWNKVLKNEGLPEFELSDGLRAYCDEPINGFNGKIDSLKHIPVSELKTVANNSQTRAMLKKSDMSLEEKFEYLKINTLFDLLFYLPYKRIDKSSPQSIYGLLDGEEVTIIGRIAQIREMPKGVNFTISTGSDGRGLIRSMFWRQNWLTSKFFEGDEVVITGKVNFWKGYPQINGKTISPATDAEVIPVLPIYRQSETRGIPSRVIMNAQQELLSRLGSYRFPKYYEGNPALDLSDIISKLHFPQTLDDLDSALTEFALFELFYMFLLVLEDSVGLEPLKGISMPPTKGGLQDLAVETLPFTLTKSQENVVNALNEQMAQERQYTTLLNADVGSGKTIVAQLACLRAVDAGRQAVLTAPTEILAKQLYDTFVNLVENMKTAKKRVKLEIGFLSGSLKAKEKRELLKRVENGEIDVIVGTHSVLQDGVKYRDLGLVCVDEQQKYGTEQRKGLLYSREDGLMPDMLMTTATPIPRSIAQVVYGQVEMMTLKDRPKGRKPVKVSWIQQSPHELLSEVASPLWNDIRSEASKGHKTFIVAPLVEESAKMDSANVKTTAKTLEEGVLSGLRIATVTGKTKKTEQAQIMADFRDGKYDVLVASTVVEVGVDIPDATRVVILSADRLGVSSIWQIKGRVGRSHLESECILVSNSDSKKTVDRLQSIVDGKTGFEVANIDLFARGEGTMFSTSQSGANDMSVASLAEYGEILPDAQELAKIALQGKHHKQALRDARAIFGISA